MSWPRCAKCGDHLAEVGIGEFAACDCYMRETSIEQPTRHRDQLRAVSVRLSDREYEAIKGMADSQGMTAAAWMRTQIVKAATAAQGASEFVCASCGLDAEPCTPCVHCGGTSGRRRTLPGGDVTSVQATRHRDQLRAVSVRLSDREYEAIKGMADSQGMTAAAWMRTQIVKAATAAQGASEFVCASCGSDAEPCTPCVHCGGTSGRRRTL